MKIKYERSFFTKISEYLLQAEMTEKGLHLITFQRFLADKNVENPSEKINIHPRILVNLIEALEECRDTLGIEPLDKEEKLTVEKKNEIKNRYLRGISIRDLCIQFDKKPFVIERILLEQNIELITPSQSKPYNSYKKYRKKGFRK